MGVAEEYWTKKLSDRFEREYDVVCIEAPRSLYSTRDKVLEVIDEILEDEDEETILKLMIEEGINFGNLNFNGSLNDDWINLKKSTIEIIIKNK